MAITNYSDVEQEIINTIIRTFSDVLNENNVKSGDIDSIIEYIFSNNGQHGCLVEFLTGRKQRRADFGNRILWSWDVSCIFLIKLADLQTIEADLREMINKVPKMMSCNETLGDRVATAYVSYIDAPKAAKINDFPFYWLPCVITVIDKG